MGAPPDAGRPQWGSPFWGGTPSGGCQPAEWPETSSPPWGSASGLLGTPAGRNLLEQKRTGSTFSSMDRNLEIKAPADVDVTRSVGVHQLNV